MQMGAFSVRKPETMEIKRISVSEKRQITIPKAFHDKLRLGKEVQCIYDENSNAILIRPVTKDSDDFSEFILADLINEGYSGPTLLKEFTQRKKNIRLAAEKMIADADEAAKNHKGTGDEQHREIFGDMMED